VRVVATQPGQWSWRAGSNQPGDTGLAGRGQLPRGGLERRQLAANPNRRGFVRASANGHALRYADGTPFFLTGDTWLAASTWRLPWKGQQPAATTSREGISFERGRGVAQAPGFQLDLLHRRLSPTGQRTNTAPPSPTRTACSCAMPGRSSALGAEREDLHGRWRDHHGQGHARRAGQPAVRSVRRSRRTRELRRINPRYFASLDRKMQYLSDEGFVPFFETVRRDNAPSWKAYFDFNRSYARYVQYVIARYGAYNMIFSGIHLDWIPRDFSLTADEFNAALTWHYKQYGPLPFGQPYTTLIDRSTYKAFGHGAQAPWLTMHTVGNNPRNHAIYSSIEELFRLTPPMPAANLEPYYTGWNHNINRPGGETPAENSRATTISRAP
jgi:hypothetical protein